MPNRCGFLCGGKVYFWTRDSDSGVWLVDDDRGYLLVNCCHVSKQYALLPHQNLHLL